MISTSIIYILIIIKKMSSPSLHTKIRKNPFIMKSIKKWKFKSQNKSMKLKNINQNLLQKNHLQKSQSNQMKAP